MFAPRCALALALAAGVGSARAEERVLRVCADPENLPSSNARGEGYENRIAALVASELHARLEYVWQVQRLGFIRRGIGADECDALMGVPAGYAQVATTAPYLVSAYAFVTRSDEAPVGSFDDPSLRTRRIGVPAVGNGGANPPPVESLAHRGITANVTGFPVWGGAPGDNVPGRIVDAVAEGGIDVAIVWGPVAGYYAKPYGARLRVETIPADPALPQFPFTFAIAAGVRPDAGDLRAEIDAALVRRAPDVAAILSAFNVPTVPATEADP